MFSTIDRSPPGSQYRIRTLHLNGKRPQSARRGVTLAELLLVASSLVGVLIVVGGCGGEFPPIGPDSGLTWGRAVNGGLAPLTDVALAPNQKESAAVGMDGKLRVHDLQTRRCIAEVKNKHVESRSVCYSPDGNQLLVSSLSGYLELWSFADDQATSRTRHAHQTEVSLCLFAPQGREFVTCGGDLRCVLWDAATFTPMYELPGVKAVVRRACFTADGQQLLAGDITGHVSVWNLATRSLTQQFQVIDHPDPAHANVDGLVLLPGDKTVLVATRSGALGIWDFQTGQMNRRLQADGHKLTSLSLSKDGRRAFSGGRNGQIDIWDITTGTRLQSLYGHVGPVQGLTITDNQKLLVSAGWDGELRFWDI